MKIKQVEELVGITSKNIRFYEEQGLLSPERAENGYREYHQEHVDTLKKIKLLRKLGVSVEEIKRALAGTLSLQECLERHLRLLEKEQENLTNMETLANAILTQNPSPDTLQTDEWLDEMEKMEREGVDFVKVDKIDIHMKKKMGAVIGGILAIIFLLLPIILLLWANSQEPLPLGVLALFIVIHAIIIICVLIVLKSRLKEIEGGEEDEAAKY
jgi:MerR family transcriptional regulator, copper efflux regulator